MNEKKGFTLIELIISLTIIMIIVAAFSKVAFVGINTGMKNKQRLDALTLAQNEMEKTRSEISNIEEGVLNVTPYNEENYSVKKTIYKEEPSTNLYTVEIEVSTKDTSPLYLVTKLFKRNY